MVCGGGPKSRDQKEKTAMETVGKSRQGNPGREKADRLGNQEDQSLLLPNQAVFIHTFSGYSVGMVGFLGCVFVFK